MSISPSVRRALKDLAAPPPSQYAPLDLFRAVAVLLVITGHINAVLSGMNFRPLLSRVPFVENGWIGVDLFFVLSGYLIGTQLWRELSKTGTVELGRFVLRRGFRIWPLYLFMFATCVACGLTTRTHWWSDLVFLTNYYTHNGVVRGSWSLCTEEHFYLLAPALVVLGVKLRWRSSTYMYALLACLAVLPIIRVVEWCSMTGGFFVHNQKAWEPLYYNFHTHCDGLVVGLILAHMGVFGIPKWAKPLNWRIAPVFAFTALAVMRTFQREVFVFSGLALFFGTLVWCSTVSPTWFAFARFRPFYWISRLSFGMYLNHGYLIESLVRRFSLGASSLMNELVIHLAVILCSTFIAVGTFVLIEFPFLEMRKHVLAHSQERTGEYISDSTTLMTGAPQLAGAPATD